MVRSLATAGGPGWTEPARRAHQQCRGNVQENGRCRWSHQGPGVAVIGRQRTKSFTFALRELWASATDQSTINLREGHHVASAAMKNSLGGVFTMRALRARRGAGFRAPIEDADFGAWLSRVRDGRWAETRSTGGPMTARCRVAEPPIPAPNRHRFPLTSDQGHELQAHSISGKLPTRWSGRARSSARAVEVHGGPRLGGKLFAVVWEGLSALSAPADLRRPFTVRRRRADSTTSCSAPVVQGRAPGRRRTNAVDLIIARPRRPPRFAGFLDRR